MNKTTIIAVAVAALLILGAVFVSAGFLQDSSDSEKSPSITGNAQAKTSCGCGCNGQCGGTCGIEGCGCN